jgi:hypothetical protein
MLAACKLNHRVGAKLGAESLHGSVLRSPRHPSFHDPGQGDCTARLLFVWLISISLSTALLAIPPSHAATLP